MYKYFENEILTRMYRERGDSFEECASKEIGKNGKIKFEEIEQNIKNNFHCDEEKLSEIMCKILEYCSIENEVYYKIGIADGFKLNKEIQEQLNLFSNKI